MLCDLKTCQRCIAYDKIEKQNRFFVSPEVILSLPGMGQRTVKVNINAVQVLFIFKFKNHL